MKLETSKYIENIKPTLKKLLDALLSEYPYASLLAVDSRATRYSVSSTGTNLRENGHLSSRGFVAKIYDGKTYGEYSFNELSEQKLPEIVEKIKSGLIPMKNLLPECFGIDEYDMLPDEAAEFTKCTDYMLSPESVGDEEIIRRLSDIRKIGLAKDERIIDVSVSYDWRRFTKLFLSRGKELCQSVMWSCGFIAALAKRGEEIKDCFKSFSILGGAELLDKMNGEVDGAVDTTLALLDSEPIEPGEYECVCEPDVTGMIVHEAFGHGVEMDMFVKDRAQAKRFIGEYVASPLVTMRDGAVLADQTATYFFDDEGVVARGTTIIEKGVLKAGMSDAQSAMFLGTTPTGNGRRESFERKAYTRMTNTFFDGGTDTPEDMIASIKHGFLLQNASSGMEDPKNWGIQCMVAIAREIRDGKLTGKIYSPIVLTGYVPDLLKSISMMSEKVVLAGGGFCGKGEKEWVKVSDGGPYIKAKIRLG